MEATLKDAKINPRTAKAALTRCSKSLNNLMAGKRPETEVRETLYKYQECFGYLAKLLEDYVKLIEDDARFEEKEAWLNECQEAFMETEFNTKIYSEANFF